MSGGSTHGKVEGARSRLAIALSISVFAHACLVSLVGKQPQYLSAQGPGAIEVRIVPVTAAAVGNTEPTVEATDSGLIASSVTGRPATAETDTGPSSRLQASQVEEARATSQRQTGDAGMSMMEEPQLATLQAPPPSGTTYFADSEVDAMPVALDPIAPRYPSEADAATDGGKVTLRLLIDAAGVVKDVMVVETRLSEAFEESARYALTSIRFKPAEKDGKAVACQTLVSIVYAASGLSDSMR